MSSQTLRARTAYYLCKLRTSPIRKRPLALLIRLIWRLAVQVRRKAVFCYYKLLTGIYFKRLGAGTQIYGSLRFGNVPSNIQVGRNCKLGDGLFLSASDTGYIRIGDRCSINTGCHIVAVLGIELGEGCLIGEYASIRDQNHEFADPEREVRDQGFSAKPVKLGHDVWVGRGVLIGRGVEIGDCCVIGANSVVTKSLPAYSIAVGAPARIIGYRPKATQSCDGPALQPNPDH